MRPDSEQVRKEAFRFAIDRTRHIPEEDIRIQGALGILVSAYLLGLERDLCQAARIISLGVGENMRRRTRMGRVKKNQRHKRAKTIATILAIRIYFDSYCQSEDMIGLLTLLMSLAVDDSERGLSEIAQRVVVDAAQSDPDLWQLLEEEFPQLCRLIEGQAF